MALEIKGMKKSLQNEEEQSGNRTGRSERKHVSD